MRGIAVLVIVCVTGFGVAITPATALQYRPCQNLGRLAPDRITGVAYGVNNARVVVGECDVSYSRRHAFIWDEANGIRDLTPTWESSSSARDVNNNGLIVGCAGGYCKERAVIWDQLGRMSYLSPLAGDVSYATQINDAGQAVGWMYVEDIDGAYGRAFTWDAATGLRQLGTLGGPRSFAYDVNSSGVVVGYSSVFENNEEYFRGFVWDGVAGMRQLPTLGGLTSEAYGITDAGVIVGYAMKANGARVACYWRVRSGGIYGPVALDMPTAQSSAASDMNNVGVIIGSYGGEPFAWTSADRFIQLDVRGRAAAINDASWIVGECPDGGPGLWRPVPEPPAVVALVAGCGLLALRRRRQ